MKALFRYRRLLSLISAGFVLVIHGAMGQHPDSIQREKDSATKRAFKTGLGMITTSNTEDVTNESTTDQMKPYEGKIIRHVNYQKISFERSIYDSTKRTRKLVTDVADALHHDTRGSVIRNHTFIKENTPLNPYLISDNERYIRNLSFLLDCRIVVDTVAHAGDSVDLTIITRDVFSLGARVSGSFPSAPELTIYDANAGGRGHRIEVSALLDQDRTPKFGYALSYQKSSLFGSLADIALGYSQLNTASSFGDETEFAYYFRINRPLVSPYSRLAGGVEFSKNWSENVYDEVDSLFLDYNYKINDVWIGYNIGIKKQFANRNRYFIAIRYFEGFYLNQPEQEEYLDERRYNNLTGYLAEWTFYRQDFYKTRYVFGFGRTEDIPYGVSLSLAGGYLREIGIERPYTAIKGSFSRANRRGNFFSVKAEGGFYGRNQNLEDIVMNTSFTYFTKAWNVGESKLRNLVTIGATQLLKQQTNRLIELNDREVFGFSDDSLRGDKKAFIRFESALYTPWQLFGFRFSPFLGVSAALMDCAQCIAQENVIWGITGGVRTRNENLIFGTMEVRLSYVPATASTDSRFVFGFRQRLTVKYPTGLVKAPSLVTY